MKWLLGFWRSWTGKSASPQGPPQVENLDTPRGARRSAESSFIQNEDIRIAVGLDFGTHSTKVVFVQLGANRIYRPMRFHHGRSSWPNYTIPAVGLFRNGGLVWGATAAHELEGKPWDAGIRRLKVLVAASVEPAFQDDVLSAAFDAEVRDAGLDRDVWTPCHVAAVALAMQMREVRRGLSSEFPGGRLHVDFAIPVPIDHVENSSVLQCFRAVADAASQLLQEDGELKFPDAELVPRVAELFGHPLTANIGANAITLFPEAQAQMASYLTSLETNTGIHAVVDIGAGTTDICIFDLRKNLLSKAQVSEWYAAGAIPKAAAYVQQHAMPRGVTSQITEAKLIEALLTRPKESEAALEVIRHDANPVWVGAYNHRLGQSYWEACPVFLCGGGAELPRAAEVFRKCWVENWPAHKLLRLPTPRDYKGNGVPFHRMAVAYGLAIPAPEHPSAVLPNDSPNNTPPRLERRPPEMDGDQLVPTRGWLR